MFKTLRIKLTFINIGVVGVIFIVFILGVYFIIENNINNQTKQMINIISSDLGITSIEKNPQNTHKEHELRYFYIKTNYKNEIIETSSNLDLKDLSIKKLLETALNSPEKEREFEFDTEESYRFTKQSLKNGKGNIIIFVNTHPERAILGKLIVTLILAGIIGLILLFFGSLYMANKALIPISLSWKRQKDFVADASHELRTPLAIIQTNLEVVMSKKEQTVESQLKWLENIQNENKRISRLVNDLLFLARTDSDQIILENRQFSLNSILLESYISLEPHAIKNGIKLLPFEGDEIDFYGDQLKINQLIIILLDNAIKYTPSGGSISLSLSKTDSNIQIKITDTGVGIDSDSVDKIFQRFYRADKARSRNEGSSGLGLAIAEWIVKEHNGTINVESTQGKGTTFYIFLPLKKHD